MGSTKSAMCQSLDAGNRKKKYEECFDQEKIRVNMYHQRLLPSDMGFCSSYQEQERGKEGKAFMPYLQCTPQARTFPPSPLGIGRA